MILGITGGSGCGKTTLLKAAEAQGFRCIDCDALYHELLHSSTAMLAELEAQFPTAFTDRVLDRKALGAMVFRDEGQLQALNRITHRYVKEEVLRRIQGAEHAAIDAFALFESGLAELCHTTVAVTAPEEIRIARLMKRDSISQDYARLRIRAQRSNETFSQMAEHTLDSHMDLEAFEAQCAQLITKVKTNYNK